MCKRFAFLLALCILAGFVTQAFAAPFPDVSGTAYADAFAYLSREGAVQGYPDGFGRPYSLLRRAEALKVVLEMEAETRERVATTKQRLLPIPLFRDVDQSQWYASYVEVAFERGIVSGYPDETFRPGQLLRVEEAVAILMRAFGESGSNDAVELSAYVENREGEWFTPSLNAAIQRNLFMHAGRLRLNSAITRGQFFDMVYRMHVVRSQNLVAYDGPEPPAPSAVRSVPVQAVRVSSSGAQPADIERASEKYFAITMPSLGIADLSVTHPQDPFSPKGVLEPLTYGVGHLFSYPGGGGKIMIYGHSSGYPWDLSEYTKIFRKVNELAAGDRIYLTYAGKLFVYEVTHEEAVPAGDTSRFSDDGTGEELILYTCWPPDRISQRYLIHARPIQVVALGA